jgi:hypothetical protein
MVTITFSLPIFCDVLGITSSLVRTNVESDSQLRKNGVMLEYQENVFISAQLFEKRGNEIFFSIWRICDEEWNTGQFY